LIVVFVCVYKIVENQSKKYNNYTHKRGCEGFPQFKQARAAIYIFIKTGDVINGNPEQRYKNKPHVKPVVEFYRDINAETLWFDDGFSVNKENNPTDCGR
jgi:hypothetical protein